MFLLYTLIMGKAYRVSFDFKLKQFEVLHFCYWENKNSNRDEIYRRKKYNLNVSYIFSCQAH